MNRIRAIVATALASLLIFLVINLSVHGAHTNFKAVLLVPTLIGLINGAIMAIALQRDTITLGRTATIGSIGMLGIYLVFAATIIVLGLERLPGVLEFAVACAVMLVIGVVQGYIFFIASGSDKTAS